MSDNYQLTYKASLGKNFSKELLDEHLASVVHLKENDFGFELSCSLFRGLEDSDPLNELKCFCLALSPYVEGRNGEILGYIENEQHHINPIIIIHNYYNRHNIFVGIDDHIDNYLLRKKNDWNFLFNHMCGNDNPNYPA